MSCSDAAFNQLNRRALLLQERLRLAGSSAMPPAADSELYQRWCRYLGSAEAVQRRFRWITDQTTHSEPLNPLHDSEGHKTPCVLDFELLQAVLTAAEAAADAKNQRSKPKEAGIATCTGVTGITDVTDITNVTTTQFSKTAAAVDTAFFPPMAVILQPFTTAVRQRSSARQRGNVRQHGNVRQRGSSRQPVNPGWLPWSVVDAACAALIHYLCYLATPALFLEYRLFAGSTASGIFSGSVDWSVFPAFVADMQNGGLRRFLWEYPILTRWLLKLTACCEATLRDAAATAASLGCGPITKLTPFLSDLHGGRSVFALTLDDGSMIHVKPHGCELETWLFEHLSQLSPAGIPLTFAPATAIGEKLSYAPTVTALACSTREEVARFYLQAGSWLCLFRHLHVTDMHCANVVAAGERLIPVDFETVLQASVPWTGSQSHLHPLWQTDFLPIPGCAANVPDYSALGRVIGSELPHRYRVMLCNDGHGALHEQVFCLPDAPSLPRLKGREQPPEGYLSSLCAGYQRTYRHFLAQRQNFFSAPDGCLSQSSVSGLCSRYVLRHTGVYNRLQALMLQPECLRHGDFAGVELERLATRIHYSDEHGAVAVGKLVDEEIAALSDWDIPLFLSALDGCAIMSANGAVLTTYPGCSPATRARESIAAMSETLLGEELAMIRSAFGVC